MAMQHDNAGAHQSQEAHRDHPQTGPEVTVTINGAPMDIKRGSHAVSELKDLLAEPQDLALCQDTDGTLAPLADDARVTIKGGEAFFSGARGGGCSHA